MRIILAIGSLAILLCVSIGSADALKPQPFAPEEKIAAMSTRSYAGLYKPNESALVHIYGTGKSSLLVYVFDPQGNCVAWDDNITRPQFCDELATEWIADSAGRYSVEIRNVGLEAHAFALAIR